MKRYISIPGVLLLMLLGMSSSSLLKSEENFIYWTETYRLKWSDFRGHVDNSTNMKALTMSNVKMKSHSSDNEFVVEVQCYFDRSKSWTKDTTHPMLLKHEQLHFDITELYTRMIREKLAQIKEKDPQKKIDAASKIFQSLMHQGYAEQERYDKETNHGIIKEKQEEWMADVKKRLAQYVAYKSK